MPRKFSCALTLCALTLCTLPLGALIGAAGMARAHTSEQGFVLLLPTGIYNASGVLTVVLTVLLVAIVPVGWLWRILAPLTLWPRRDLSALRTLSNAGATLVLIWLIAQGFAGTRDPLRNPLSLGFWTLWWGGLILAQGVIGNHWRWLNPWRLPAQLNRHARLRYPRWLGSWPALTGYAALVGLLLCDIAPADPDRLATALSLYSGATLAGLMLFGPRWLLRAETVTVTFTLYSRVALFGRAGLRRTIGLPGWQILHSAPVNTAQALLCVLLLGAGSFDGLNETYWWLGWLGINPLDFPGRSAVQLANLTGLVLTVAALALCLTLCLRLGAALAGWSGQTVALLRHFAPSLLPIALAYHLAHYLPVLLIDGQYLAAAIAERLGLTPEPVTTSFFFDQTRVRQIWLTQAGAVVAGHVSAVLVAHGLALRLWPDNRRAWMSQTPLTLFMIGYTILGLWLLATPRAG